MSDGWWDPTMFGWPQGVLLRFEVGLVEGRAISLLSEARSIATGDLLGMEMIPLTPPRPMPFVRALIAVNLRAAMAHAAEPFPGAPASS